MKRCLVRQGQARTRVPWRRSLATILPGLVLLGVFFTPGVAGATDWPSYKGGPQHNPVRAESPGTNPSLLWSSVESTRGEPCVITAGGAVYVVASPRADFGAQRLMRIDAADGTVDWQSPTFRSDPDTSCPAADSSHVYVGEDSSLVAHNVADGSRAWAVPATSASPPAVVGGTVYYTSNGTLYARSTATGAA